MTIANDLIFLSLRNSGVSAIGQTPMAQDVNDAFRVLNAMILEWEWERTVQVNRTPLPVFPDLTTDVPFWSQYEHVLLTTLAVRLRQVYSLPPIQLDVQLAAGALKAFSSINLQYTVAPTIAADDGTGYGVVFLALRAAGRVTDAQGVLQTSQDVTDAHSLLNEMIDEWQRERTVRVISGTLSPITDLSLPLVMTPGEKNAVVLNLGVRLRDAYGTEVSKTLVERADRALQLLQAINLQQTPPPTIAADDGTGFGIIYLALRTSGRVTDNQGVLQSSQDVTDAHSLLSEMLDEWQRERTVRVIPGTLALITDLASPLSVTPGEKNALVLNLGVRLRDWFGAEPSKPLIERADRALQLLQAINLQQNPAPTIAADDGTGYGLVYLALRAAGRVTDNQGITQTSQDVTDAASLMNEMLDEWNRERAVRVIPGTLPTIPSLAAPLTLTSGVRNAIVLNLAVRLRDWVGAEVSKTLLDRATTALGLVQANNQHQTAPIHPGPPETVIEALFLALRMAGRITDTQSVSDGSKDVADAFSLLVMMLGQWQRKRWLVWHEEDVALVSTGADFYTIGPGEDFDCARPDKIHAAKVILGPGFGTTAGLPLPEQLPFPLGAFGGGRTPNLVNIPLAIIEAKEDWNKIAIPDLKSIPSAVFYDSSFPVGRMYFWPVAPANAYELQLTVKGSLPVYTTVNDALELPPEYLDAIVNNLAVRIALASPGAQVSPLLLAEARASLNTIKLANTQIPLLSMPAALVGRRGGDVSSWSGPGLNQAWIVGGANVLG